MVLGCMCAGCVQQTQQPSDICSVPGQLFPLRRRLPKSNEVQSGLSGPWVICQTGLLSVSWRLAKLYFFLGCAVQFSISAGLKTQTCLLECQRIPRAKKCPKNSTGSTVTNCSFQSAKLTCMLFDQNRISREVVRYYCSAGSGSDQSTCTRQ